MDKLVDGRTSRTFWMHNEVVDVWAAVIGPFGLTVYAILSRHADARGKSFPKIGTIAKKGKMSERMVQNCLRVLAEHKLLNIEPTSPNGVQSSNTYTLLDMPEKPGQEAATGACGAPVGVHVVHPTGACGAPPIKDTQVKEESSSEEEDCAFPDSAVDSLVDGRENPEPETPRFNAVKAYMDAWRETFPDAPYPDIPPRFTRALKALSQRLGPAQFTLAAAAYFSSQHYQAVQGGYNVKTFLDWPIETWTQGKKPPPPASRDTGGTLDEQKAAMRRMREGK